MHVLLATIDLHEGCESARYAASLAGELRGLGIDVTLVARWESTIESLAERLTTVQIEGREAIVREGRLDGVRAFYIGGAETAAHFAAGVCDLIAKFAMPVDILHGIGESAGYIGALLEERHSDNDKLASVLSVHTLDNLDSLGASVPDDVPSEVADEGLNATHAAVLYADALVVRSAKHALDTGATTAAKDAVARRAPDFITIEDRMPARAGDPSDDASLVATNDAIHMMTGRREWRDIAARYLELYSNLCA